MRKYTKKDVKVLKKESLHKRYFETNLYYLQHRTFEGGWTPEFTREVFERGHAAAVLLYDPDRSEFVMLEQFRFPAMETSDSPWMIEVVAGIIGEGETAKEVCVREAIEEAGIEVTSLVEAPNFLVSPGGTTERLYTFVGRVDSSNAGGIFGLEEETEDIKVHVVSESTAKSWLDKGEIDNATALILLQWFFLNRDHIIASL
ncbi:MAG: NUDIX domain-containing protein [Pseudomonadota bacterium]